MSAVLDASALLASLQREPGGGSVRAVLGSALRSAVRWTEVIRKAAADSDREAAELRAAFESLGLALEPFSAAQAGVAGSLRRTTATLGLSLGDRACLALAIGKEERILTADRVRERLRPEVGIGIEVIR